MIPYTDIEVTDKYIIREFNENIDPIELMWHRDDESRTIEILEDTRLATSIRKLLAYLTKRTYIYTKTRVASSH
jgi:CRISPR/Cas system type I-B associated protein Csh2 (Cas7 group RAMP superfamily)